MVFNAAIEYVLLESLAIDCAHGCAECPSYVVPVGSTHLQATVAALGRVQGLPVAGNVLELVASSPVTWACPSVSLKLV